MERENRQQVIRDLFAEQPMSIGRFAHAALDAGVFSEDELDAARFRWAKRACQDALKITKPDGRPFAGPSAELDEDDPGEGRLWKQYDLWSEADFDFNITQRREGIEADYVMLRRVHDDCLAQFGRAPTIPILTEAEVAAHA